MRKELKFITVALAVIGTLVLFFYIFMVFARPSSMLSYLPDPPVMKQYALLESGEKSFPVNLSAFLTEGPFAMLHKGTSRHALLSMAPYANGVALLIVAGDLGYTEVYAAYKLPARDAAQLGKGEVPESWQAFLPSPKTEKVGKGIWRIWSPGIDEPINYYTDKENIVLAAGEDAFQELTQLRSEQKRKTRAWRQEKSWPGHMELGDGAHFTAGDSPLSIQFAWHNLPNRGESYPAAEAKWSVAGLKPGHKAGLMLTAKSVEWKLQELTLPSSPILAGGLNIPKLKGSPLNWPSPLSALAGLLEALGMSENSMREVMSGKTVLSLGGKNKLLWFSLPGITVQFTGKEKVMRELVDSFWKNFFLDSEPRKLEGWDYGGAVNAPFSVVGVGRGGTALIGAISSRSLRGGDWLLPYMGKDEKAIGWLVADMPKLGESLSDMTKVTSLLTFEDGEGSGYISGTETDEDSIPFRPGELDQGIADSFGKLLKKLGNVCIVWEKPTSGRLSWHITAP